MRVLSAVLLLAALLAPRPAAGSGADPLLGKQWGLERIQAAEAWSHSQGKGALVAVIDTGIDLRHPDLRTRVAKGGRSFVGDNHSPKDDNGHGTHISGIIAAASGNGHGGSGVAPKAKILPVRVCDSTGMCEAADMAAGIRYAADKGAHVINISIASALVRPRLDGRLQMVLDAVAYATREGSVVVAAAGNLTLPICQEPAASSICVGATTEDDTRSFYSNGDATLTTRYLVAPGGSGTPNLTGCESEIISTFPRELSTNSCGFGTGYTGMSGTSMAGPFVSGVAALLASQGLDATEIVDRLLATTDDLGVPGRDSIYGYGRVNALKAVTTTPPA